MKKLKVNLLMVAALAIGAVAMSFKMVEKTKSAIPTTWFYVSDDSYVGAYSQAGNWSQINNTDSCVTEGERPCQISVEASNQTQLASVLSGKTNAEVLSMSINRKE